MSEENRRQHYRIPYNVGESPTFKVLGKEYPVMDLSETGLRFGAGEGHRFRMGESVHGEVVLPDDGGTHKVSGVVVRLLEGNAVALKFHNFALLPLRAVMSEQRRLIRKRALR